jgi:arginyl-tRNA synthetase
MIVTERLTAGLRTALASAGLPPVGDCAWEVPRQPEHGDYATNVAMTLARAARRPPRQVAEAIREHFPAIPEVDRLEVAGPGFLNVFLSPRWCGRAVTEILGAGDRYGAGDTHRGQRVRVEFVSANPTGPLVIVNARAAAVGDALVRLLRRQGALVTAEYYINDAGNQFDALARSLEARVRQALGEEVPLPENGYPGEYLVDLAREYLAEHRITDRASLDRVLGARASDAPARLEHFGAFAVERLVAQQRRVLEDYGVVFDVWTSERRDVRDAGLADRAVEELAKRQLTYEDGDALWFRASQYGDEKDRVVRKSDGELTYFAVDLAFHHYRKFGDFDRVVDLIGPDHHGYIARMRAAMTALGHPAEAFDVLIVQLVTLLRDGQPVRMSKRRGEFVLMEELLEEVGRDAARFTFLTRRHDSPVDFDLAVAARQTSDNPVYYVQYAHARICSITRQASAQGIVPPPWTQVDTSVLTSPEEQRIAKHLLSYPETIAAAARALEPHRVAYWLQELAGLFHPYYKAHRVIQDDQATMFARMALCAAVGHVLRDGLALLGVSAPESM